MLIQGSGGELVLKDKKVRILTPEGNLQGKKKMLNSKKTPRYVRDKACLGNTRELLNK